MYFSTIFTAALASQLLSASFASPAAAPLAEDDLARREEVFARFSVGGHDINVPDIPDVPDIPEEITVDGTKVSKDDIECGAAIFAFGAQFAGPWGALTKFPRLAKSAKAMAKVGKMFRKGLKEEQPANQDEEQAVIRLALELIGVQQVLDHCAGIKKFVADNKGKIHR